MCIYVYMYIWVSEEFCFCKGKKEVVERNNEPSLSHIIFSLWKLFIFNPHTITPKMHIFHIVENSFDIGMEILWLHEL